MRDEIAKAAATANRSMNAEIIYRLETSFPENLEAMLLARRQEEQQLVQRQISKLHSHAVRMQSQGNTEAWKQALEALEVLESHSRWISEHGRHLAKNVEAREAERKKQQKAATATAKKSAKLKI